MRSSTQADQKTLAGGDSVASAPRGRFNGFYTKSAARLLEVYTLIQEQSGALVPPRKAFNPATAKDILPHLCIAEIAGDMVLQIRLTGTAIVSDFGHDPTGTNYMDLVDPANKASRWHHVTSAGAHPVGFHSAMRIVHQRLVIITENLSLPMTAADGVPRLLLSMFVPVEKDEYEFFDRGKALHIGAYQEFRWVDIGAGTPAAG